jgi:nucleoside-diphosphate-sugar epimerase
MRAKVLVTGASGYLGRYAVQSLHAAGFETVLVGRAQPMSMEATHFICADLLGGQGMDRIVEEAGATHLLHLAWYAEHGLYWQSAINFDWVRATIALVDAFCRHGGTRIVGVGSCAEYDWSYGFLREDVTPYRPATVYGSAKSATRQLMLSQCTLLGVSCAWAHVFFPYGAGEHPQRLVPSLVRALGNEQAPFGVSGASFRDFLYAPDAADGLTALLQSDLQGPVNVCSGEPVSIAEFVRGLAQTMGAPSDVLLALPPSRVGEPKILAGDSTRLRSTGWKPRHSIQEGLRDTLRRMKGAGTHTNKPPETIT